MTRTPHSFSCAYDTRILYLLWQPFKCNNSKRLIHKLHLKGVTVGFQILYICVTSIKYTWHWLYNNSLSLLYELNGSTQLPCDVKPYPLTRADAPLYVLEGCVGSATGWMLPEIIKTYVLMQNMWKEFSYVSLIYTIIM